MSASITLDHQLALSKVSRIRETLEAFFRSSECGLWTPDDMPAGDEATLCFRRGNWEVDRAADAGNARLPGFPRWTPQLGYVRTSIPMLLSVTVSMSEDEITIQTSHTAYSRESGEDIRSISEELVSAEVRALAKYLKNCYGLARAPEITRFADPAEVALTG